MVRPLCLANIVVVHFLTVSGSGDSDHRRSAQPAEQFPGQHILSVFPVPTLRILLVLQAHLHLPEQRLVDNRGNPIRYPDAGIGVDADVHLIPQHSVVAVPVPQIPASRPNASPVQVVGNLDKWDALADFLKNVADNLGFGFLDYIMPVLSTAITERNSPAIDFALRSVIAHSSFDVLREICGIILGGPLQNGFQQNALRPVRYGFLRVYDPDAVPFQTIFVGGAVVAIPGKAVNLPRQNYRPATVRRVLKHLLELRPFVRCAGKAPVGIDLDHAQFVRLGIRFAIGYLLFDGGVPLGVG